MTNKSTKDLQHKVGQLLILGFDGLEISGELFSLVEDINPGGVILFARNLSSPVQCYELLYALQLANLVPMFKCIDLEGGTVDRFKDILAASPSAEQVFATGKKTLYRKHGALLGELAHSLGFNTDFAPVSDIGFARSKPVLTTRTVSADPAETTSYVSEFLHGLQKNVLGCGKHFPGLGEGTLDSHHDLPVIEKSWKQLWVEDLLPYRQLHRQFPFVMVAHADYPSVTTDKTPASLSRKWLKDILRKKIGYRGIILSDDLEMGGVLVAGSIGEVAVETLRAGADMFLVCHRQEAVQTAWEAVVQEAERDRKFRLLIDEKYSHILRCKKRWPQVQKKKKMPTADIVKDLKRKIAEFQTQVGKVNPL